ncbi:FHA domain-containing protein [Thermodesulfobacteriota bacterium]
MTLLGLELSDAGIIVAGGRSAKLLEVDGHELESPGYAIPEKTRLLVGKPAADKAHLFPLQVINQFWDQLDTTLLKQQNRHVQNHAELACAHLSLIWENVRLYGDEMIIAVPDYYGREQLGLILGMAQELSIPVQGFVSLPIAASSNPYPNEMLLHLDIHLHRLEIAYLYQGDHLTREDSDAFPDISLGRIYRRWVESIAEEFVHTTRFDPLHQALTEQELYNRLPAAIAVLKRQPSFIFEIAQGKHTYRITLLKDMLKQKSAAMYEDICRFVEEMRSKHKRNDSPMVLQLTHRIARLPGLIDELTGIGNCEIIDLEPGAGALGTLRLGKQLPDQHSKNGVSFFTSRPWQQPEPQLARPVSQKTPEKMQATHLLYRDVAYPISDKPLFIGCDNYPVGKGISIQTRSSDVSKKHCAVQQNEDMIVLTDYSRQGTFVENKRVDENAFLKLGQIIRLGTSGETIRLIACMNADET